MALRPSPDLVAELIERIRQLRTAKGISQNELDDLAGVPDGYVGKVESGMRRLSLGVLDLYAQALGARIAIIPPIPIQKCEDLRGKCLCRDGRLTHRPAPGSRSKMRVAA